MFGTSAGTDWIVLLEALEQPHRSGRLRRLAVSPFVGWDAAGLEHNDVDRLALRLRYWLRVFQERGVAALFETISRDERLPSRLLGQLDGERRLTDLRHVAEALHAETMAAGLGLTAGLEWLQRRVADADEDSSVERSRRLDSDSEAVQVVTVHASKGLEFPIVLVPFGWDRWVFDPGIPLFHDDVTGRRVRNVGGRNAPGFAEDQRRHKSEEFGEDLRLLYVALTRAQSQVTAWWAPSTTNTRVRPAAPAAVHRCAGRSGARARAGAERCRRVDAGVGACRRRLPVGVRGAGRRRRVVAAQRLRPQGRWPPRRCSRGLDTAWRRTSYSALIAGTHTDQPMIGSEPEVPEKDDEPVTPTAPPPEVAAHDVVSPMAAMPGGTAFGTLVHAVLEQIDPTADDLAAEVHAHIQAQLARSGPADIDAAELTTALLPALRTPLGPLAGDRSLADIAPSDRLTELDFELPLCGGDRPHGTSRLADLADLLRAHLPADDPLAGYADLLGDPVLGDAVLKGYLGGSIDAVLRVDGRYVVVDYKTNRLGEPDQLLTALDYRGSAMADAMLRAHYPLQALLYEVALHRFLRWRLADYDPSRDLGGVLYLFLRGMCGPGVGTRRRDDTRRVRVAAAGRADRRSLGRVGGRCGMTSLSALHAPGLLREFDEAGVLAVADVQVATRLGALVGETDDRVLLAVALIVRGTRQGSVVLDLAGAANSITPDEDAPERAHRAALAIGARLDRRVRSEPDRHGWAWRRAGADRRFAALAGPLLAAGGASRAAVARAERRPPVRS